MSTTAFIILIAIIIVLIFLGLMGIQHMIYRQEEKKRLFELKKESQKTISPLRMRAYERLSLLLERTEPESLVKEIMNEDGWQNKNVTEVQRELLQRIRLEFDHNMSQQIYVSDELWRRILLARDEMAAFVNQMAIQLRPGSTTVDYLKTLLQAYHMNGDTPHEMAMQILKDEAKQLL